MTSYDKEDMAGKMHGFQSSDDFFDYIVWKGRYGGKKWMASKKILMNSMTSCEKEDMMEKINWLREINSTTNHLWGKDPGDSEYPWLDGCICGPTGMGLFSDLGQQSVMTTIYFAAGLVLSERCCTFAHCTEQGTIGNSAKLFMRTDSSRNGTIVM
jgi:hypothetical protein